MMTGCGAGVQARGNLYPHSTGCCARVCLSRAGLGSLPFPPCRSTYLTDTRYIGCYHSVRTWEIPRHLSRKAGTQEGPSWSCHPASQLSAPAAPGVRWLFPGLPVRCPPPSPFRAGTQLHSQCPVVTEVTPFPRRNSLMLDSKFEGTGRSFSQLITTKPAALGPDDRTIASQPHIFLPVLFGQPTGCLWETTKAIALHCRLPTSNNKQTSPGFPLHLQPCSPCVVHLRIRTPPFFLFTNAPVCRTECLFRKTEIQ
ncbi:uncharacterized protein BDZ83DRAFT_401937 [Colletotrichum acutatum]|uniref:Uncharacterized protein n=1 Tax=Glomerella acutata TaxID=27357 RepID=A0AAD8XMU0_GLOAC|nr:uncharacterized protein BDZ83DRAFT_401937 [Colletotrichum acutatum]KAK1730340.1 hypothetical protein BDZ83DRAFT_401937 [Colletotrichum acutatum]